MSLHPESLPPPYQAIGSLVARHSARVAGVVRSVRRRTTADGFSAIEVELVDPTGVVLLEFLGRLEMPELAPGIQVVAQGVPLARDGGLVMVNPWYACVAQDARLREHEARGETASERSEECGHG